MALAYSRSEFASIESVTTSICELKNIVYYVQITNKCRTFCCTIYKYFDLCGKPRKFLSSNRYSLCMFSFAIVTWEHLGV